METVEKPKKIRGNFKSKFEVAKIQNIFNDLYLEQGKGRFEIQRELKMKPTTYYRYLDKANESIMAEYLDKEPRILSEYIINSRNRRDKLMATFAKKNDASSANAAQRIDDGIFDRLQSIGALQRAPELLKQEVVVRFKKDDEVIIEGKAKVIDVEVDEE